MDWKQSGGEELGVIAIVVVPLGYNGWVIDKTTAQNNTAAWRLHNLPALLLGLDQAIKNRSEMEHTSVSQIIDRQWFVYSVRGDEQWDVPELRAYYTNLGFKTEFCMNSYSKEFYVNILWGK